MNQDCDNRTMTAIDQLQPGDNARIISYDGGGPAYRKKLMAMGLTPGTQVKLHKVAPLGDPVVLNVRGSQLTLRKNEAQILIMERCA